MKSLENAKKNLLIMVISLFTLSSVRAVNYNNILVGNANGLYALSEYSELPLWKNGAVKKIVETDTDWFFLTSKGILHSSNLSSFDLKNNGLPVNLIKHYDGKDVSFSNCIEPLKDLEVHPSQSNILVTLTRDTVFLTQDGGIHWKSLGFSARTNGAKAVAVCSMPNKTGTTDLTIFISHSIYGISYIQPEKSSTWHDITAGFENMTTLSYPDEIADIKTDKKGNVFLSQTFLPRLYTLDWQKKRGSLLTKGNEPQDTWDSLAIINEEKSQSIMYVSPEGVFAWNKDKGSIPYGTKTIKNAFSRIEKLKEKPLCTWIPSTGHSKKESLALCELWMLRPLDIDSKYQDSIDSKYSLFIPPTQVLSTIDTDKHLKTIKDNKINSIVINMKDDYGLLRYKSEDPEILEKAHISSYAVDIDTFVSKMKEEDIYLIARIVVFKDRNLWRYNNGAYAIKDSSTGKPWQGIKRWKEIKLEPPKVLVDEIKKENSLAKAKREQSKLLEKAGFPPDQNQKETIEEPKIITKKVAEYYDEHWVDPYSEEVWKYNTAIAKELIKKGFDEIQFDYIRFPTDGINLYKARYSWQNNGMQKEDALISFLSYARKNIQAPIGIDIYGANGWYRSGARTGQDVELMAPFVDVICPMFYPSHFEQDFLAYKPAIERPYRVYFYGTYRNSVIARNQALIRPWLQAFYLPVSYDKKYYDDEGTYVKREMFGVRDSVSNGYMFWNNSGRYTDISPTPQKEEKYPWKNEATETMKRSPSLSRKMGV